MHLSNKTSSFVVEQRVGFMCSIQMHSWFCFSLIVSTRRKVLQAWSVSETVPIVKELSLCLFYIKKAVATGNLECVGRIRRFNSIRPAIWRNV